MAEDVSTQSAEDSTASDWLKQLSEAAVSVYTAEKSADAARDAARAANAQATTTQPNWLLIGGIGAAVLLLVGLVAFRK